jgi:hypothetical protein
MTDHGIDQSPATGRRSHEGPAAGFALKAALERELAVEAALGVAVAPEHTASPGRARERQAGR